MSSCCSPGPRRTTADPGAHTLARERHFTNHSHTRESLVTVGTAGLGKVDGTCLTELCGLVDERRRVSGSRNGFFPCQEPGRGVFNYSPLEGEGGQLSATSIGSHGTRPSEDPLPLHLLLRFERELSFLHWAAIVGGRLDRRCLLVQGNRS